MYNIMEYKYRTLCQWYSCLEMRRTLEYLAQFEEFRITEEDCKEIQSHRVASSKDLKIV